MSTRPFCMSTQKIIISTSKVYTIHCMNYVNSNQYGTRCDRSIVCWQQGMRLFFLKTTRADPTSTPPCYCLEGVGGTSSVTITSPTESDNIRWFADSDRAYQAGWLNSYLPGWPLWFQSGNSSCSTFPGTHRSFRYCAYLWNILERKSTCVCSY